MGIEALLLGTAAPAAGTAAAAGAAALGVSGATAGLIGSGGTLSLGSLASGFSALSGISSLFGGVQGLISGNQQSSLAMQHARLAALETERVTAREARLEQDEINRTLRRQKLAYMASGVTLEGSPLLVMEETRRRGQDNIDEILRGGQATGSAQLAEGRIRAKQLKGTGRAAFMTGITNAGNSFSSLLGDA